MNYLTNYYKNLSEQLQEQVNQLENMLDEARRMTRDIRDVNTGNMVPTRKVEIEDWEPNTDEDVALVIGKYADNRGKGAQKNRRVSFYPGSSLPGERRAKEYVDASELGWNWAGPPGDNVFMRASQLGAAPLDVRASEIEEIRRKRGGSVKGRGQKYQKKLMAQIKAEYLARQRGPAARHDRNPSDNVPVYVDSRTAAIRQQPPLKRYSPSANPGRIL
jgi:hypothetical protein